jgi:predicted nucleotidyltransferase
MATSILEAVSTLRAREAAARDARDRHRRETLDAVLTALRQSLRPGEKIWVFGSLVWDGFASNSDVDLALDGVAGARLIDIERAAARAAGVPVDLVDLADLPASFRQRIVRDGLLIE